MTLAAVMPQGVDLRAIISRRIAALSLTRAALAVRMAPRWGCQPDSAEKALQRLLNRAPGEPGDMTSDKLASLLDELGLEVRPADDGASG